MHGAELAISLFAMSLSIPMIMVPTILFIKLRMRARELEHMERMRALELGRPWPAVASGTQFPRLALALAFALGVVMPIGVFLAAARAHGPNHERALKLATGVAVCGVVGGTILARRRGPSESDHGPEAFAKSTFDDEFDVVGRRG